MKTAQEAPQTELLGDVSRRLFFSHALMAVGVIACGKQRAQISAHIRAASSLRDVLRECEPLLTRALGFKPQLAFGGSQTLALQLGQGAPGDLFLSASARDAEVLAASGKYAIAETIASTPLMLCMRRHDSTQVTDLKQLVDLKRIVLGSPASPIGAYTRSVLERARERYGDAWHQALMSKVVSWEASARLLRSRVELGAADATILYKADVLSGHELGGLALPTWCELDAQYVAVARTDSTRDVGLRCLQVLRGQAAQSLFRGHGFEPS